MDFVIIANAWGAGVDNPTSKHRIALELARRGHRVLWLSGAGMRRPSLGSGRDRGRMMRRVVDGLRKPMPAEGCLGVHHVSPLLVPLPAKRLVRRLNGALYAFFGRWWAWRLGLKKPILINYVPTLGYALKHWPWRRVYHCVDLWSAFDMYDTGVMVEMDALCCTAADTVIATSQDLYESCRKKNPNTHLVMHGVDYEHFRESFEPRSSLRPTVATADRMDTNGHEWGRMTSGDGCVNGRAMLASDISATGSLNGEGMEVGSQKSVVSSLSCRPSDFPEGPIVGFFGLLSEWLDQDLILKLSRQLGNRASIVLIGTADVDVSRLERISNIHLLGPKPFSELPQYIAHFMVGIIPFVVNELTRAVNPIKLREMLAAGCPVVSSALPEVERMVQRKGVVVSGSQEEFVAAVKWFLANPLSCEQRMALSDSMASESWSAKVDQILAAIGEES